MCDFRLWCSIFLTAAAMGGCASSDRIQLVTGSNQQAIVRDGQPTLVSTKRNMILLKATRGPVSSSARPRFVIAVFNRTGKAETLSAGQVSALVKPARGKPIALRVFSYEELVKEEQDRQTVAAVAAALSGVGRAMSASQAGYVQSSGSYHGSAGGTPYAGSHTATSYDPLRAQIAQSNAEEQTSNDFARLRAQGEDNLARLDNTILKDHTVMPNEWYGGVVVLDKPEKDDKGATHYSVTVAFGGELHEFEIKQARMN